jgi:chromosome segregation ATPase
VTILNDESNSFARRIKSTQGTLSDTKKLLADAQKKISRVQAEKRKGDEAKRELMGKLEKSGRQVTELDEKLVRLDGQIAELQRSKAQMLRESAESGSSQQGEIDSLRAELLQLKEAEGTNSLQAQKEDKRAAELQRQLAAAAAELEASQNETAAAEADASESKARLKALGADLKSVQAEFQEYKGRATRVLQTKEKIIADLRQVSAGGGDGTGGQSAQVELIEVRRGRDQLQDELLASKALAEQLQSDITALEEQQQDYIDDLESQLKDCEKRLAGQARTATEVSKRHADEVKEYAKATELAEKSRFTAQNELAMKVSELERARAQLMKRPVTSDAKEAEIQLRSLTDNLLAKQAKIEALSSQTTNLTLQLEAEKRRREETRVVIPQQPVSAGEEMRMRPMRSMLDRNGLHEIQSINKAVTCLDAFSVQLGTVLRRYPMARLMVILYMIILHIWTLVVLLSHTAHIDKINTAPMMIMRHDA